MAQVFPTLLRIYEGETIIKEEKREAPKLFTVLQDLERGCLTVQGSYHVLPSLEIVETKHPHTASLPKERLALGVHKKQEWEQITRRGDMREIFPLWHRLGLLSPQVEGTHPLFEACKTARPEEIFSAFHRLFLVCMEGMLVPRLHDADHQGISDAHGSGNPLGILSEGAHLIRSLFFQEREQLHILPRLPPECVSGRMIHLPFSLGEIALEWTKKEIRRVIIHAQTDGEIAFAFRHQKTMRCDRKRLSCTTPLEINSHQIYVLDRFEK